MVSRGAEKTENEAGQNEWVTERGVLSKQAASKGCARVLPSVYLNIYSVGVCCFLIERECLMYCFCRKQRKGVVQFSKTYSGFSVFPGREAGIKFTSEQYHEHVRLWPIVVFGSCTHLSQQLVDR